MNTITLTASEQAQFGELMGRSYKKVYSLAYRLAGNRSDAEDLTQEAFFRAYRGFREFEGDRPFENWIFRIVTRLFLDLVRSRKRRIQAVSYDAPPTIGFYRRFRNSRCRRFEGNVEDQLFKNAVSEDMETALNRLKPEQKTLVLLADVENVPYDDIAEILGVPVGTVRSDCIGLTSSSEPFDGFEAAKQAKDAAFNLCPVA